MAETSASGSLGIVASGHTETSGAVARVLEDGGNAFDAVLAGMCAATVAEPMLISFGGGGFLVARQSDGARRVYDFFCQTPLKKRPEGDIDFYPIMADFGGVEQEFHIGMGSMAVPGLVAGLFAAHADLGRLPLKAVLEPAQELARNGVAVNDFQGEVIQVLTPILKSSDEAFALYASPADNARLLEPGETQRFPHLPDFFELLLSEGAEGFYQGECAKQIVRDCQAQGGQLSLADFAAYRVERREPVRFRYRDARIAINSPPSLGGGLVAFALGLLEDAPVELSGVEWGSAAHLTALLRAMRGANAVRDHFRLDEGCSESTLSRLLAPEVLAEWRSIPAGQLFTRGTTHISVADREGNLASMTASNGEGCGYVLPGTDIMLNNMLGEEDLNPRGFHRWQPGARLASMMSPAVSELSGGRLAALGSGGSNRIRSAVTQVLVNLVDFGLPLEDAVRAPRMHLEKEKLSIEGGFCEAATAELAALVPKLEPWGRQNLFFGGVHAVVANPDGSFEGAGDPRRGGVVKVAP